MNAAPAEKTFLRDLLIVAGQELAESIRTKRALLLLLLFCGITAAGTLWFIKLIQIVEQQLTTALALDAGTTGSTTATLWNSKMFRGIIVDMVGDRDLAESLLRFTPLGLFFGWLTMTFTPWLVALTSSARITEEIWSGSARFVLCRTTRLAWICGKFTGQALQLLVALALCIVTAWLCGRLRFEAFDGMATFGDMLLLAPKAWIYGVTFLGLVTGLSLFCKSPGIASVLGMIGLIVVTGGYHLAHYLAGEGWRRIFDAVQIVLPQHHYFDLMRPDWDRALPATVFLAAMGLACLLGGYARLARKDL